MAEQNKILQLILKGKDDASKAIDGVSKSIENNLKQSKKLKTSLDGFAKSTKSMGKGLTTFATAPIVALGAVAVKGGAELDQLEASYKRMTDVAKINGEEMLTKMREVSRGTISNKDLILSANKAMSLGVISSQEDIGTIMDIARTKGQNMGLSMQQAFDDLVTGLGRGSAMILDNLGIVINATEAQEAYATSIGKTTAELSAEERKQALVNAVIVEGKKEMAEMGEIQTSNKERLEQLNASMVNFKDSLGKQLLPVVIKLVEKLTVWIERWAGLSDRTKNIILIVVGLVAVLGPLLLIIGTIASGVSALITVFGLLMSPIGAIVLAVVALIAVIALLYLNWEKVTSFLNTSWEKVVEVFKTSIDKVKGFIDGLLVKYDGIIQKAKQAIEVMKQVSGYNLAKSAYTKVSGAITGRRASGGLVSAGQNYLVGEKGAEIFSPSTSGRITPNGGAGQTININITGNKITNKREAEALGDLMIRKLKTANMLTT